MLPPEGWRLEAALYSRQPLTRDECLCTGTGYVGRGELAQVPIRERYT